MARLGSGPASVAAAFVAAVFIAATGSIAAGAVGAHAATPAKRLGATHAQAGTHHRRHAVRRHADQAAFAGDRHHAHSGPGHAAAGGAGLGADSTPYVTPPYPYDGHLAGDGLLHTGILGSNVLRAFGIVPN